MLQTLKRWYYQALHNSAVARLCDALDEEEWVRRHHGWTASQPNAAFVRKCRADVAAIQQRLNELN
jgi:hypothetical protein